MTALTVVIRMGSGLDIDSKDGDGWSGSGRLGGRGFHGDAVLDRDGHITGSQPTISTHRLSTSRYHELNM